MAREVGIRELKDHASAVVDAVQSGEAVTVTRRGRAVARLVPIDEHEDLRATLAGRGIAWSGRRPALPELVATTGGGPDAATIVIRDRGPR